MVNILHEIVRLWSLIQHATTEEVSQMGAEQHLKTHKTSDILKMSVTSSKYENRKEE